MKTFNRIERTFIIIWKEKMCTIAIGPLTRYPCSEHEDIGGSYDEHL